MFAPTWVQKVLFIDRQKEKYTAQPFSLTSTRKRSLRRIYAAPPSHQETTLGGSTTSSEQCSKTQRQQVGAQKHASDA